MSKRKLSILLVLTLVLTALLPSAAWAADNGWEYKELSDGTLEITGYTGPDSDLVIPQMIGPKPVTSIGYFAFYNSQTLTSVTIHDNVTSIGDNAFGGCNNLTTVSIGSGVTSICSTAFGCNFSLTEINVASGNKTYCSVNGILFSTDKKTLVAYPGGRFDAYSIPDYVASIGDNAFGDCYLSSVTIPAGVTSIGYSAFAGCNMLTGFSVASGNKSFCSVNGVLFNKNKTTLIAYPGGKEGPYTIPNSVTRIGDDAFEYCLDLTGIVIPSSVTSIGSFAFRCCEQLTTLTIPNSVTRIGNGAFNACYGLTSVTIPGSVTEFGDSLFTACIGLTSVTIANGVSRIGSDAFAYCDNLKAVTIPASVTSIDYCAFDCCDKLTDVYYTGTAAQWANLKNNIDSYNDALISAKIHYIPRITSHPQNATVAVGGKATFKVTAVNASTYQWQASTDGGKTWTNSGANGNKTATLSFTATAAHNNYQFRCVVTGGGKSATSKAAKLTVSSSAGPTITTQPANASVAAGATASFKVVATGAESYTWHASTTGG